MDDFIVLFLDDDKERHKKFTFNILCLKEKLERPILDVHVYTAKECIEALEKRVFTHIFLDHDLGERIFVNTRDKETGSEVARWLKKNPDNANNKAKIFVHSLNEGGVANIQRHLPSASAAPFVWETFSFDQISW